VRTKDLAWKIWFALALYGAGIATMAGPEGQKLFGYEVGRNTTAVIGAVMFTLGGMWLGRFGAVLYKSVEKEQPETK
jgi:hypothetical protein